MSEEHKQRDAQEPSPQVADTTSDNTDAGQQKTDQTSPQAQDQPTEGEPRDKMDGAEDWQKKYNDVHDKYVRVCADVSNIKRRQQQESLQQMHRNEKAFILDLIPHLDNLERAVENCPQEDAFKNVRRGMVLILSSFRAMLTQRGLKVIDPKEGDKLDPEQHEVVGEQEAQDAAFKGNITLRAYKGYKLHEAVIRPAQVIIGK